ncbi:hypothetical protein KGF57_000128 [Candida theae]|uniref:Uncharacterized protein n=1 Tax=Candida theae TaxID=1198502 RepID=A0AAD5BJL7_9ASCO|nr:uncharacterized protein KGF57_000128 [Candida theae]KAI5968434.1 hypothetical protein KGF57_000128 [Candida theae]
MVVTRSKLHKTDHSHDNGNLNNPEDVSSENILGYDDTYSHPHIDKPKNKKITFDEDGESIQNGKSEQIDAQDDLGEIEEDSEEVGESEDDDSDEAPEEESTNAAKEQLIAKQKQEQQRQSELAKQAKERRKLQNERFKQQQLEKKQKELSKQQAKVHEELPEFLPDDIESILSRPQAQATLDAKPKHIRLDDVDLHLSKKQQIENKLRELKKNKSRGVQKGPVYVKTQTFGVAVKVVPRGESKILKNKHKWLHRKSIDRK